MNATYIQRAQPPSVPAGKFRFSTKDLFDVAGEVTTAGSVVLRNEPAATMDATAVARLKAAGGLHCGRTNMSEFAFSGVGFNPHYGTPANVHIAYRDKCAAISGGSSSGAAVSVGSGDVDVGLGSDTGGSVRIPAALCGLVGLKATARLVPTQGVFPLSPTLDAVGAITRDVRTAIAVHETLSAQSVALSEKPLWAYRAAVVRNFFFDDVAQEVAHAFEHALGQLTARGLHVQSMVLPELNDIEHINATGGFSPIEAYRYHRRYWAQRGKSLEGQLQHYDGRVAQRILRGAAATDTDVVRLHEERAQWIARVSDRLQQYDAVLSPTVPLLAPSIASVAHEDSEFFRINALLLRNPSVVNLLDGCAISIPCSAAQSAPVGLMIWHYALQESNVLALALRCEAVLSAQGVSLHPQQP